MRRTNRIEPINIDPRYLACAVLVTTTQLEIVKQVEITPTIEAFLDRRTPTSTKSSRKIVWCIGCLFFIAGMLALSIVITGFTVIFRRMKMIRNSNIERYDLGDLHYGINNVNYPSNTYLSHMNKASIQNYLSEQLLTEPGYLGMMIDDIFVQNKSSINQRKPRAISCSIIFIIQNTQVYFDHCSTCIIKRNSILRRLFFNRTAFKELFYLLLNNRQFFTQICSTPNLSHLILPQRLAFPDIEKINTHRKSTPYLNSSLLNDITTDISTMGYSETTFIDTSTMDYSETTISDTSQRSTMDYSETTFTDTSQRSTTDHWSTINSLDTIRTEETSSTDKQTSVYTTESSIPSRRTTPNVFQFLPFRPSTTLLPWRLIRKPRDVIRTDTSLPRTSTEHK